MPVAIKVTGKSKKEEAAPDSTLARRKCDPIEILAMFATGDVVGLGLMTAEEFRNPGRWDKRTCRWLKLPGVMRALDIIPPDQRMAAAKELAPYFAQKKTPVNPLAGLGTGAAPVHVQLYIPQNGRDTKR